MTQAEGNHGGNRRRSQATQDSQRSGGRVLEGMEEGVGGRTRGTAELSSGAGVTTTNASTDKIEMMTKAESNGGGGINRQQPQVAPTTPSNWKETKEPQVVTRNPSEWPPLPPLPTTAVMTLTAATRGSTPEGENPLTRTTIASKATPKTATSSKSPRASYPIFNRQAAAQGKLSSSDKGKNNIFQSRLSSSDKGKNLMTMVPEAGATAPEADTRASAPAIMAPLVPVMDKGKTINSNAELNNSTAMVPVGTMALEVPAPAINVEREGSIAASNSMTAMVIGPTAVDDTERKLNFSGPNTDNSTTMVWAPALASVTYGEPLKDETIAPIMMQGITSGGQDKSELTADPISNANNSNFTPQINNSTAMVIDSTDAEAAGEAPAPMEGTMGQEGEGWNKVKPSKKKHKVKPNKKQQKKLVFKNIPREAASKSRTRAADSQGINSGTGGGNRPTKTATIITPPQGATKKRKSSEDDKEEGQEEGAVGMEVEEEKTMERGTPRQPSKSVKQTSEKFISIRQTKAMSQWYLACISNKSVQGLDRDVNLTEEDLKPGSEFYGRFQWACDYSMRDKVGDDKKTVLRDPNHWFQTLTKVPNGDDLRKSEDPAKRKAARNVLEVGIDLARSPMELFKDQFVCDNRKFGLDPSEETAELVAARAAAYKFFGPVYQYKADLKSNGEVGLPVKVMRKVNAPKNSRRLDLAVNPDEAVTAAKCKALEDAEAAQEEDPPVIQYMLLTLPPSGTPPTPFWKDDMSEEEKRDYDEKQALCLDVAGRQLKEIVLGIFVKDSKAEILPHTHKLGGDPYTFAAEAITADNLDSRFPMNIWQLRRYLSRASPRGGDAEIQGDMDISTVLTVPQIQEAVKLAANCNKDLLNGVKMKANECGSSRLQCVGWLQFASTRYENKKELTENLGSILFNGKKVTEFRLQNGSPPKGIREELDLNSREDFLASKVIEVFTSDEHASNVVQFFQWAFPLQGSADPMLHRDYRFILSSTCTYSSIGTANSPESKEMNIKAWKEHMKYTRDSACIDCIDNVRVLDAQISEGVDMTIGEFMMRLVDRAQDKVPLIRLISHQAQLDPRTKRLRINVVCHRDNVEKVQIIIAFLFLVLQAQYPKLNVDGPFYPEKVTALKSTYILGDDSVYTNSVTQMRLDPKTHPIYRARSKAHMSLRIKGCTMFDRQAQDPSDVTVTSSKAPTIHTQEGDKDSSEEEDNEERHDMEVDSTATKKSDNQSTFRSLGTGKQSSAGSADAEAAMRQMTIGKVPTEIPHGQQQNGDDMDDASVLSETSADFEHNNADSSENPNNDMDRVKDGTADNPVPLQDSSSTSESEDDTDRIRDGTSSTSESEDSNREDSTEYKEDTRVPEVEAGLLPDSQASPNKTISEQASEEAYGTDDFGVQTIHGVPTQLWCTTRHQGAYTKFEVDEHPDWGTGKPDSHWDYRDLELMSKRLAGTHLPYYDKNTGLHIFTICNQWWESRSPRQKAHQPQDIPAFLDEGAAKTYFVRLMMKMVVITFLQGSVTGLTELSERCAKWTPRKVHQLFGDMERRYGVKMLELETLMGLPDVTDPAIGGWNLGSTPSDVLINEVDSKIDAIMDRTQEPSPAKFSELFGEWYSDNYDEKLWWTLHQLPGEAGPTMLKMAGELYLQLRVNFEKEVLETTCKEYYSVESFLSDLEWITPQWLALLTNHLHPYQWLNPRYVDVIAEHQSEEKVPTTSQQGLRSRQD
jgi:hypothetical protein